VDFKEGSALRAGRVRVEIKLDEPLKTRKLVRIEGRMLWLDFCYERLSYYCYSCGKLGHYATYCEEYPFDEAKLDGKEKMAFGPWLRAEVRQSSPYWDAFYNPPLHQS